MKQNIQTIKFLRFLNLLGFVLLCLALGTGAKSIQRLKLASETDPMMALPSGQEHQQTVQYVAYEQIAQSALAQTEPRQEMVIEYQPQQETQMAGGGLQQGQPGQQYDISQIQGQQQQSRGGEHNQHSHDGVDCNQRHELTAILDQQPAEPVGAGGEQGGGYPGQLVYVNQGNNGADDLKSVAAAWSQASDLSATILTEIPVKDMPQEVLNKLRRDYGVKVVATRERPGSNLVINCDEYLNQENSICKRHLANHEADYQQQHNRAQVESGEAMGVPPRQQVHAFQHVEHVIQPMQQTGAVSHVYAPQEQAENHHQTGDDSRGGNEQSGLAHTNEESGYEGVMSGPAGGATHYENNNNNNNNNNNGEHVKGTSKQVSGGGGGDQSDETGYANGGDSPQADQQQVERQPDRGRDSYELASSFDEQQQQKSD